MFYLQINFTFASIKHQTIKNIFLMKYYLRFLFLFLSFACVFGSCKQFTDTKFISEGTIEYNITYLESEDNAMKDVMPKTMTLIFKDDKMAIDLTGGFGLFKATWVSDFDKRSFLQMVKIMNQKFAIMLDSNTVNEMNDKLPKLKVEFLDDTKKIANYHCKHAKINFENPKYPSFDIYYTNEINIKNPNWSTQFKAIDGVMLEYQMKRYNIEMKFTAKKIISAKDEPIDNTIFERPADYKLISREHMDELLSSF